MNSSQVTQVTPINLIRIEKLIVVPIGGNGVVDSTIKDGAYALNRENIQLSGLIDPHDLEKIDIDVESLGETLKTFGEWIIFIIEHISGQLLAVLRIADGPEYINCSSKSSLQRF